jgi:hypothetical protein
MKNRLETVGTLLLALGWLWGGVPAEVRAQDPEPIVVMGQGFSEDSARNDALRKALEQGAGAEISSRTDVENFQLIRDTIYARADGIVSDYKILESGRASDGGYFMKISAIVRKDVVASTWGEVQNVLDQIGRPGITIFIQERIDGQVQDSSILESQLENRLITAGFKVYAGEHLKDLAARESADAMAEDNVAKVRAVAKDYGAQIFITGTAQANSAGVREVAGQRLAMYNGDALAKMYYTDTGQLVASESLPDWRGGARGDFELSPQAGKKALENAGQELVDRLYRNTMKFWATQISAGGEITLEVEGISVGDALKLKKRIQEIDADKIKNVNQSLSKNIATFHIKAKMTGEELAEHLVEEPFGSMIEIIDLKANRLQAKWKAGAP